MGGVKEAPPLLLEPSSSSRTWKNVRRGRRCPCLTHILEVTVVIFNDHRDGDRELLPKLFDRGVDDVPVKQYTRFHITDQPAFS